MNIFYLDSDPNQCAKFHCNKHVVKMILEHAQILSTVWQHYYKDDLVKQTNFDPKTLYRTTHAKHPSTIWASKARDNYKYLYDLTIFLGKEYTFRYYKRHKSISIIKGLSIPPVSMVEGSTTVALAMPEKYKTRDPVQSYRNYYKFGKTELLEYKFRDRPTWLD